MKIQLVAIMAFAVLLASVAMADSAFAEKKPARTDLKSIMDTYKKTIEKAQADFLKAMKKSNTDAKAAIAKGVPTNEINANSKAAMLKAKAEYNAAKTKAQEAVKASLDQIKASIKSK